MSNPTQQCPHCGNWVEGKKVKSYTNKVTRQGAKTAVHMATSAGGMATGAAVGSAILPGIGTVVGGALGFIGSAMFNQKVNENIDKAGDAIEDNFMDMEYKFVCPKCGHEWSSLDESIDAEVSEPLSDYTSYGSSRNSRKNDAFQICCIVADKLRLELDEVKTDSDLEDDLGADDLDKIEIIMEVEKTFNCSLGDDSEEVAESITYVDDLIEMVVGESFFGENLTEEDDDNESEDDSDAERSRFKSFFDSYINEEYKEWSLEKKASMFEREGENCSDETIKSMYYCVAAVIRLETFVEEWLVNGFDNYKDTSKEFCQKCLVKGFEDIQISREIIPQDKEYQLVDISFIMLNYFWIEDDEDLENYTSLYDDFLKLEKEETALFNYDWLIKLFKHSYDAIFNYCNKNKGQVTAEEQEYLDSVRDILEDYGEIGPRERRRLEKDRVRLGISKERAQQLEASLSTPSLTEEEQEYLDEYKEMLEDYEEIGVRERKRLEKSRVRLGLSEARARELEGL